MWTKLRSISSFKRRAAPEQEGQMRDSQDHGPHNQEDCREVTSQPLLSTEQKVNSESKDEWTINVNMGRGQQISPTKVAKATDSNTVDNTDMAEISGDVCLLSESPYKILKMAAKGRIQELKKILYQSPERLEMTDKRGWTPFHHAVVKGQVETIQYLLDQGADISVKDKNGNTGLHLAIDHDQLESLVSLLKNGAPTDVLNNLHRAPIHVAVEQNKPELLEFLVTQKSVDVNLVDGEGSTALHYSAWKDHPECARVLLEAGAMMCKTSRVGLFPLHVAAQSASSKTLQTMLDHGV